jgi:hypothetical protein
MLRIGDGAPASVRSAARYSCRPVQRFATQRFLGYATSVAVSPDHACAQMNDGSVRCWGVSYALGDGETTLAYRLGGAVTGAQGASMLAGGNGATCDLIATDVECWGSSGVFTVKSTPATIY